MARGPIKSAEYIYFNKRILRRSYRDRSNLPLVVPQGIVAKWLDRWILTKSLSIIKVPGTITMMSLLGLRAFVKQEE